MPRATLTITLPESLWIGSLSRTFADATMRILSALPGEERGVGLVEVTAPRLEEVLAAFEEADPVADMEVLEHADGTALLQFETTNPLLLFPIQSSGIPLEMPFDIEDGSATWEVTASHDRLSELGEQLEAFGIRYRVEEITHQFESEDLLTDRQETLIDRALERGYYDTPRTCTLTELAEDVGLAKSTASETLHRAEGKIVREFRSVEE
ncbi:MAG: helix-turn-helix domain-containing protein [Halanaeroarchaeum sp.]